jgi:multidrug efflux pump subunit AcrA (membrane-fusion protein)
MLIPKKSWNLSLDSLSDTMTNGVGILILMLLSVTPASMRESGMPEEITSDMMRQAQARCAELESRQEELRRQWEALKADEEQKKAELESLQLQLQDLKRFADMPQSALAECIGLGPAVLASLLQTAGGKLDEIAGIRQAVTGLRGKLNDLQTTIQDRYNLAVLENDVGRLKARVDQLKREKDELEAKTTQADLERAAARELQKKLEDLNKEIDGLNASISQLQVQVKQQPDANGLGGSYTGPYVLLECDGQGATVHPDGKRLPLQPSQADIDWLNGQVKAAGAVALVSRPSGFDKSFDKFYETLIGLADEQKARGRDIVLILWPIEENEKIDKYLWKKN